jgi:hypothetical protein
MNMSDADVRVDGFGRFVGVRFCKHLFHLRNLQYRRKRAIAAGHPRLPTKLTASVSARSPDNVFRRGFEFSPEIIPQTCPFHARPFVANMKGCLGAAVE